VEKFRYLQHTADAKFQAFGRTLEQAFTNAALATVSLMWDCTKIEANSEFRIRIIGRDEKQLLVNFLEEILFLLDSRMFLLREADGVRIQKNNKHFILEATLIGDTYSQKYKTFGEVKAITYNEMEITRDHDFIVQVVVDM
jgi:SHS2 domain-containing protein